MEEVDCVMKLQLEELNKWYPNPRAKNAVHALKDVNLTLDEGIYGLTGHNGAGKSTLIKILTGNLKCSSGNILLNGETVDTNDASYKKKIGYMPQQQWVYEDMTCIQFINYMAALKQLSPKEKQEEVERRLSQVNLIEKRTAKIGALSGGMKQRLLLAQAMLGEPVLLILDEPTAGVDPDERNRIKELIDGERAGKIVLISTHILSDLEGLAEQKIVLEQGMAHLETV
jgi:ABC-type multidrug transport system ATPase subunit